MINSDLEKNTVSQEYAPWNKEQIVSPEEILQDLLLQKVDGGFTLPYSLEDKLILFKRIFFSYIAPADQGIVFKKNFISVRHQAVLNYLYKQGVVDSPHTRANTLLNDSPKFIGFSLRGTINEGSAATHTRHSIYGYGTDRDPNIAISKTIGELLERFYLSIDHKKTSILKTPAEVIKKKPFSLDPRTFHFFEDWQNKEHTASASTNTQVAWVKGHELISNKPAYIPAQCVFWRYPWKTLHEPYYGYHTTSGGAGHFTQTQALIASIYENVQRDGFLIYWHNTLSPNIITHEVKQIPEIENLLVYAERYGLDIAILDTTSDIPIPSVVAVVSDREKNIAIGSGTGFSIIDIVRSAILESISVHHFQRRNKGVHVTLAHDYAPFTDPSISRKERLLLWQGTEMYDRFSFFLSGARKKNYFLGTGRIFKSPDEELRYLKSLFAERHEQVYTYEVKSDVLKKLGYHVVKTILPSLVPLYLDEHLAPLNASRLHEIPSKIGYAVSKINPYPHPFP